MPANAYESGARKIIPAVLVYAERDGRVLMLHRNAKANDYHEGKWNGLGGKCEPWEAPIRTAARELEEESGLRISEAWMRPLGTLLFPDFKPHKSEDWLVYVFGADVPEGAQAWARGPEGDLVWVEKDRLLDLRLWRGDRHFLPYVLRREPFQGVIWYRGEDVLDYRIDALSAP